MKRLLLAVMTLAMTIHGQTVPAPARKPVVFACDLKALTPAQRKRQAAILSPTLKAARVHTSELPNGYAFQFPSDAKTFAAIAEWVGNERLCCPFFQFDLHVGKSSAPVVLRITGPEGVKQFIRAELSEMVS